MRSSEADTALMQLDGFFGTVKRLHKKRTVWSEQFSADRRYLNAQNTRHILIVEKKEGVCNHLLLKSTYIEVTLRLFQVVLIQHLVLMVGVALTRLSTQVSGNARFHGRYLHGVLWPTNRNSR